MFYWSGFCQEKEPLDLIELREEFIELRVGYGFGTSIVIYMGQVELEKKTKRFEAISYSFEYYFSKSNGGFTINNPGSTTKIEIPVRNKFWYANIKWHPIRTARQPFSWLFISGGVGYSQQNFMNYLDNRGPGIKGSLGVQYTFIGKLTASAKIQYYYYYNLNMDGPTRDSARIKATGVPLMLSIGYRFFGRQ